MLVPYILCYCGICIRNASIVGALNTHNPYQRNIKGSVMDAVQFGQWMSKRRHACGFRSQRTLAETTDAINRSPTEPAISENFLARLEAGQLAHPFRGSVRRRVLALAWYLCKTPQDVKVYLRAAG